MNGRFKIMIIIDGNYKSIFSNDKNKNLRKNENQTIKKKN